MKINLSLSFAILSLLAVASCKTADVKPKPIADFTYQVISVSNVQKTITFTNTSKNADRYQWSTPTGLAKSTTDFSFDMTENGRVNVSLTAKSDVGEDTKIQSIDVTDLATTGSVVFWSQIGDKGNITINVNGTYQGLLTRYKPDGVAPSCNQEGFVTVTLPPGTYPFTAKSEGLFPTNWTGSFTVVRGACRNQQLLR